MFNHSEEPQSIQLDETSRSHMLEVGRWGKFLAIIGFVSIGILVVVGLLITIIGSSTLSAVESLTGVALLFIYLVIGAIYFYPIYAIYQYGKLIKQAIATEDQETFNAAFGYLKGSFKYIGILMLILLSIYALAFVVGLFASFIN